MSQFHLFLLQISIFLFLSQFFFFFFLIAILMARFLMASFCFVLSFFFQYSSICIKYSNSKLFNHDKKLLILNLLIKLNFQLISKNSLFYLLFFMYFSCSKESLIFWIFISVKYTCISNQFKKCKINKNFNKTISNPKNTNYCE